MATALKPTSILALYAKLSLGALVLKLLVGFYVGSLGLISDGLHSANSCAGLWASLVAARASKGADKSLAAINAAWRRDGYSYGPDRAETLAAFANSLGLLFATMFVAMEALHRTLDSAHHNHSAHVVWVSSLGIVVNACGLFMLMPLAGGWRRWWSLNLMNSKSSASVAGKGVPSAVNMDVVVLNALVGVVSSASVLGSSLVSRYYYSASEEGESYLDTVVALTIAVVTTRACWPIFARTASILAQGSPPRDEYLERALRDILALPNVLEITQKHFWTRAPGRDVASIVLRARSGADVDALTSETHRLLAPFCSHITVQVDRDGKVPPAHSASAAGSRGVANQPSNTAVLRSNSHHHLHAQANHQPSPRGLAEDDPSSIL